MLIKQNDCAGVTLKFLLHIQCSFFLTYIFFCTLIINHEYLVVYNEVLQRV